VPQLSVAVNGAGRADISPGWPLVVRLSLLHPAAFTGDEKAEPLVLAAKQGPSSGAVRLKVRKEDGGAANWPFRVGGIPPQKLSLDARAHGALAWGLGPEDTAGLSEGTYELTAVLDTRATAAQGAWNGEARSETITVRVTKEPTPLSPELEHRKYLLLAEYALFRSDLKGAQAQLERLLAQHPKSIGGLAMMGEVLAAQGKTREALGAYDAAIAVFYERNPKSPHPPMELYIRKRELAEKLRADPKVPAAKRDP
jgi:hypothetical protein